jgi:hypothetical protein
VLLQQRDKILATHPQHVVDEGVQMSVAAERQVPLKDHSIETTQDGYNGAGELVDERDHGVLLWDGW